MMTTIDTAYIPWYHTFGVIPITSKKLIFIHGKRIQGGDNTAWRF